MAALVGVVVAASGTALVVINANSPKAGAMTSFRSSFDVPKGYGATVPFKELEAEKAHTNGRVIGPDISHGSLGSEASGRSAVELGSQGKYVEFTLTAPANAVNISVSVPKGREGTLSAYVNGTKVREKFAVHTKYTHIESYIQGSPKPYHLYNDYRIFLGTDAKSGDKVRIQVDAGDNAAPYTVDLAQFEQVGAPLSQPAGSVSVVDAGADPTGAADSTAAFTNTISQADGRTVWVPKGRYKVGSLNVNKGVTLRGAGPWHTVIDAINPTQPLFSSENQSGTLKLSDFAAFGQVTRRVDDEQSNFMRSGMGRGGLISNVWIQNFKCGIWLMGPSNQDVVIENNRMLALLADGVNFNGHVTNGVVRNNYLRNQGDDALAVWSIHSPVRKATFSNNTVVAPNLANGIGVYGGVDTTVSKNVIADTNVLGSGIDISNQQFQATNFQPLNGVITVSDNHLIRTGMMNPNWNHNHPMSAIRFDAYDYPIGDGVQINVTNNSFFENPYSVFQFLSGSGRGLPVKNVNIDGAVVDGIGTMMLQAETSGSAKFSNVKATGVGAAGVYNCAHPQGNTAFTPELGPGNSGWSSVHQGCEWPERKDAPAGSGQPTAQSPTGEPPTLDPPTLEPPTAPPANPRGNLAAKRPVTESSHIQGYVAANAVDGNPATYWESTNRAFPQSITVDLGSAVPVSRIVMKTPTAGWPSRTQTVLIEGSTDGSSYSTVKPTTEYAFEASAANTVAVTLGATRQRYLRITFTANTIWPAGQLSELEVYAS